MKLDQDTTTPAGASQSEVLPTDSSGAADAAEKAGAVDGPARQEPKPDDTAKPQAAEAVTEPKAAEPAAVEPKAATFAELKGAFPNADAAFREQCLESGATLEQARDRWAAHLETKCESLSNQLDDTKAAAEALRGHEGVEAQVEASKQDKAAEKYADALPEGTARFAAGYTIPTRN